MIATRSHRLALLALAALAASGGGCAREPAPVPNVVLITIDTLRADHLGVYGAAAIETPAIDALARQGVRFENAFTPVPLTLPAHWTLHTGLQPWQHGVVDNGWTLRESPVPTLAERFAAAGYDTAAFVAAFVLNRSFGLDRGFARYDDGPAADAALDQLLHATASADERVGRALRWLTARSEPRRPFFLWLHLFDPHAPYEPPSHFRSRYRDRPYDGEIAFVDSQIARLLAGLERQGVAGSTLVVLTSDHGESLGEHGEMTHGILLYDATLHVPLIFRLPAGARAGEVRRDPVSLADLAPTVLGLAGLAAPAPAWPGAGRDLFAADPPAPEPLGAISEAPRSRLGWAPLVAVREGDWKFIAAPRPELYHLGEDPGERHDRFASERRRAAALAGFTRELANQLQQRLAAASLAEPTNEDQAALAALGYVGGGADPAGTTLRPDPKDELSSISALDQAYQLLAEGQLDRAAAAFESLLESSRFPPAAALEGLARVARLKGHQQAAEAAYLRWTATDPAAVAAWAQLVLLARERGDLATAIVRAKKLTALAPRDGAASRLLAEALHAQGDDVAAEQEWQRGLAAAPAAGWLRLSYATFLAAAGRAPEARQLARPLLEAEDLPENLQDAASALAAQLNRLNQGASASQSEPKGLEK